MSLKPTPMQPALPNSASHVRRAQLLPGAQQLSISSRALSITVMHPCTAAVILLIMLGDADAWGPGGKYAVNCPENCSPALCGSTQHCRRTVLDDCGCCQVCAAGRGEHCYRTVSGMHGVKCGPGLFCDFYKDEDDYGDEYGICKDCMFGTYGIECRKTCNCKAGGLCDRETGACLSFKLLAKMAKYKPQTSEGNELGSGDSSRSSARNFLTPR